MDGSLGEETYFRPSLPLGGGSGRSHSETWAGCIASLTTSTRSSRHAFKSVSSLIFAEKISTPRRRDRACFSNHPGRTDRPQTIWSKGTL